ncbi:PTS lactose transporter subunit IIA [Oceanobacillus oncorhynchi subsp. incaldanensis]|uniref:PTS system lactose-specific EIIA component n=1 Tax=Oceanobacillus aidingensis TaxID=645964 RepID=A0ABV9JTQ2_9BACI|nr:PTS lactose/cellobiose transporter subunit IIA [Oceanobacillus oncorhynchi]MDM8101032.1 PTS lactose/cellobiose transporter subunit IIA [Oceanobacillus oncorhynchi]GIO18983.1 PTS lactose transporter subunit IIA [Oceanobacillus oncorhynchi subsp. incaldanensis]
MNTEQVSFKIISLAGDAFSTLIEALQMAKKGNFQQVEVLINTAKKQVNEAHDVQTNLIVKEAQGETADFSVLLIHAQDTLMNTILMMTLVEEMISMYVDLKKQIENKGGAEYEY